MIDHDKATTAVRDLLTALDVDEGDHTADTPDRVARHWAEALDGYTADPGYHLSRTFRAPGAHSGPVIVTGLRLISTCAHHLLPITGTATVAYRPHPGEPVVGLSKLARLLHGYARRLQVQERIGHQVVDTLMDRLAPAAAGCVITAEHGCMTVRGVAQHGSVTTTAAWAGEWNEAHSDRHMVLEEHRAHR